MNELEVYIVCYGDGYPAARIFSDEEVLEAGGVAAVEADLRETAMWFYPLGTIIGHAHGRGGLELPLKALRGLMDFWQRRGAPKRMGMAIPEVGPNDENNDGFGAWQN